MSERIEVPCILCGAAHECTVTPGEAASYELPASGPEVDWRRSLCDCGQHPVVNEGAYWERMDEAAIEAAQKEASVERWVALGFRRAR